MAKLGVVALGDTQNDSTQSWNFGKNWSNSMADSKLADKNSIQTVIQFKKIGDDSIQLINWSICQVIINTGRIR